MKKIWQIDLATAQEAVDALNKRLTKHSNPVIKEMIDFANEIEEQGKIPNIKIRKGEIEINDHEATDN